MVEKCKQYQKIQYLDLDRILMVWLPIAKIHEACSEDIVHTFFIVDLEGWLWHIMFSILLFFCHWPWFIKQRFCRGDHSSQSRGLKIRDLRVCLALCASPHRPCMCSRMWRCYAESVRCRTGSIWPRVEISLLCWGGLQRRWTSLHLAGRFKGHLTSRLTTADPHHITEEKGLPEADTASPLVVGKRRLSWSRSRLMVRVRRCRSDSFSFPRWTKTMFWTIIWPEL